MIRIAPTTYDARRLKELRGSGSFDRLYKFQRSDGRGPAFSPGDVVALEVDGSRRVFVVSDADADVRDWHGFTLRLLSADGRDRIDEVPPGDVSRATLAELADVLGHRVTIGTDGCAWIPSRDVRYRRTSDSEYVRTASGPMIVLAPRTAVEDSI